MTPIGDDCINGTTSNKEYRVWILLHSHHENPRKESCTALDGSNAPKWIKFKFAIANYCKGFFPHGRCRGGLGIVITPD